MNSNSQENNIEENNTETDVHFWHALIVKKMSKDECVTTLTELLKNIPLTEDQFAFNIKINDKQGDKSLDQKPFYCFLGLSKKLSKETLELILKKVQTIKFLKISSKRIYKLSEIKASAPQDSNSSNNNGKYLTTTDINNGDIVRIFKGIFKNFSGKVISVNKSEISILITLFNFFRIIKVKSDAVLKNYE